MEWLPFDAIEANTIQKRFLSVSSGVSIAGTSFEKLQKLGTAQQHQNVVRKGYSCKSILLGCSSTSTPKEGLEKNLKQPIRPSKKLSGISVQQSGYTTIISNVFRWNTKTCRLIQGPQGVVNFFRIGLHNFIQDFNFNLIELDSLYLKLQYPIRKFLLE